MARSTALLCLLALALFCKHAAATFTPLPPTTEGYPDMKADDEGRELEEVVRQETGKDDSTFSRYFDQENEVFVARVVLQPCTALQPHWHDTTETIYGLQNKVYVGVVGADPFHPELSAVEVQKGQFSVFPKGLLHFQYNPTCSKSVYLLQTCTKSPFVRFAAADMTLVDEGVQKAIYGKYMPNPETDLFVVDKACLNKCNKSYKKPSSYSDDDPSEDSYKPAKSPKPYKAPKKAPKKSSKKGY